MGCFGVKLLSFWLLGTQGFAYFNLPAYINIDYYIVLTCILSFLKADSDWFDWDIAFISLSLLKLL